MLRAGWVKNLEFLEQQLQLHVLSLFQLSVLCCLSEILCCSWLTGLCSVLRSLPCSVSFL